MTIYDDIHAQWNLFTFILFFEHFENGNYSYIISIPPTPPMSSLFPLNLMTSYLLIIIHICPHVHICTHKYYLLIHLVWLICICLGMTTWDCITYWGVHPWRRLTLLVQYIYMQRM